jgi:hypothetical protein
VKNKIPLETKNLRRNLTESQANNSLTPWTVLYNFQKTEKPAAVKAGDYEIKEFFHVYLLDRAEELYRLTSYINVFSQILLQLHIPKSFEKTRIHCCQQLGKNGVYTLVFQRSFLQETTDNQQKGRNMAAEFVINLLFKGTARCNNPCNQLCPSVVHF